jgi:hypothetical protein
MWRGGINWTSTGYSSFARFCERYNTPKYFLTSWRTISFSIRTLHHGGRDFIYIYHIPHLCCMYCPFPYSVFKLTVLAEGHQLLITSFVKSRTGGDFATGTYLVRAELRRMDNINMDITKMY